MADEYQLENLKSLIDNFWKSTVYSIKDFDPLNKKKPKSKSGAAPPLKEVLSSAINNPLPLARIKKIMKADPDVKMVSQEVPILVGKITEIFIKEFSLRASFFAKLNSKKTINVDDYKLAMCHSELYDFLIDVVPLDDRFRLSRLNNNYAIANSLSQSAQKQEKNETESKKENTTTANTTILLQTPKVIPIKQQSVMGQAFNINQENTHDITELFFNLNNNEGLNENNIEIFDNHIMLNNSITRNTTNTMANSNTHKTIELDKANNILSNYAVRGATIHEEAEPLCLVSSENVSNIKMNNY